MYIYLSKLKIKLLTVLLIAPRSSSFQEKSQPSSDSASLGSVYLTGFRLFIPGYVTVFRNKKGKAIKPVEIGDSAKPKRPWFAHYHAVRQLVDQQEPHFQETRKRKRIAEQEKNDAYGSKSFPNNYKINFTYFVFFFFIFLVAVAKKTFEKAQAENNSLKQKRSTPIYDKVKQYFTSPLLNQWSHHASKRPRLLKQLTRCLQRQIQPSRPTYLTFI